nr:MAG TPA: hypothetical protein [Caudoviricetes sp.]
MLIVIRSECEGSADVARKTEGKKEVRKSQEGGGL